MARYTPGGYIYQYNVTDHLGNVRVVVNEDRGIEQFTDYYPFGLAVELVNIDKNKYLYNGKELQDEVIGNNQLGWLDYGARPYDPKLGRWGQPDPLMEKYFAYSPYSYVLNNPIKYIDPDGMEVKISHDNSVLSEEHREALKLFVSTEEGMAFIARFMSSGSMLEINGTTYLFGEDGDRAKDILTFRSTDSETFLGLASVYTKDGQNLLDITPSEIPSKIISGVHHVIDLKNNKGKESTSMTIGHEALAHTDRRADDLNYVDSNHKKVDRKTQIDNVERAANRANRDHRDLGDGKITKYEEYSKSLTRLTKNKYYENSYKKEVKRYKNTPDKF